MSDHPLLLNPERRRAYEDLCAHPSGTERTWSARWGWSRSKVTRFLNALVRYGLAELVRTDVGTLVLTRTTAEPRPNHPPVSNQNQIRSRSEPQPGQSRTTAEPRPNRLESRSISRSRPLELGPDEEVNLIRAMNQFLWLRFDDGFDEVSEDNRSSLATARKLLRDFAYDEIADELRKAVALFNPSKHGKGKLPWSLTFFEKGLFKALRARAKYSPGQTELLAVVRGEPKVAARTAPSELPADGARPAAIGEVIKRMGIRS